MYNHQILHLFTFTCFIFFNLTFQAKEMWFKMKLSTLNQTNPTASWRRAHKTFAASVRKTNLLSGLQNTVYGLDFTAQLITFHSAVPYTPQLGLVKLN